MAKKDFYIPQIKVDSSKKKEEGEKSEKRFKAEPFIGPYTGPKAKNKFYFPYVSYGNKGMQYESLRDKPLVPEEN